MTVDFEEADRLMGEDPDDRAIREAHGFTYEDDWQDGSLMCRNGCGLSYPDISSGKIRQCSATGNLADFLAARYDEAEKLAREAEAFDGAVSHRYYPGPDGDLLGSITLGMFHHANRPKLRLADIKLKRAILAEHERVKSADHGYGCKTCDWDSHCEGVMVGTDQWCATVRQLGTEFDQHEAYQAGWAP